MFNYRKWANKAQKDRDNATGSEAPWRRGGGRRLDLGFIATLGSRHPILHKVKGYKVWADVTRQGLHSHTVANRAVENTIMKLLRLRLGS